MRISLVFSCKWRVVFAPNYVFTTKPKLLVNLKTGNVINQISKGGSIGYVINSKFYSLTALKNQVEIIPIKEQLPF
jgi:hypothetical protein